MPQGKLNILQLVSYFSWRKSTGETLVTKLRKICLFEANFNYWTKLIFACRMIKKAHDKYGIPGEVYATKASQCDDASTTKIFFCDLSKIRRHPAATAEADLGE